MRRMGVAAVRHVNDGLELMRFRDFTRGFKAFTFCLKLESLARVVGSHCFNSYRRVRGHGTRLFMLVMKKESEARDIGFKDSDFNKAVTEIHEEVIVRSALNDQTVMRPSAEEMKVAVVCAAKVLDDLINAKSLHDMVKTEG